MGLRVLLSLILILSLVGCTTTYKRETPSTNQASVMRKLPPFDTIVARGDMMIKIIGDTTQNDVRILGPRKAVEGMYTEVKDNVLYLQTKSNNKTDPSGKSIVLIVRSQRLHRLAYEGNGSVDGVGIKTHFFKVYVKSDRRVHLRGRMGLANLKVLGKGDVILEGIDSEHTTVDIEGDSKVTLTGVVGLTKLDYEGAGCLSMHWIDSHDLIVNASGTGELQLAGVVGTFEATIKDKTMLDARYLRATQSYVKTYDKAEADIYSIDTQYAFAADHSDIYYHARTPRDGRHHYMAALGSILDGKMD